MIRLQTQVAADSDSTALSAFTYKLKILYLFIIINHPSNSGAPTSTASALNHIWVTFRPCICMTGQAQHNVPMITFSIESSNAFIFPVILNEC